jgi:hypothetical protein
MSERGPTVFRMKPKIPPSTRANPTPISPTQSVKQFGDLGERPGVALDSTSHGGRITISAVPGLKSGLRTVRLQSADLVGLIGRLGVGDGGRDPFADRLSFGMPCE